MHDPVERTAEEKKKSFEAQKDRQYIYTGNIGVLVENVSQLDQLKEVFNADSPENSRCKIVNFDKAVAMVAAAKETIKEEDAKVEDKPKAKAKAK